MESGTANLLDMLLERVCQLTEEKKWDEAMRAADSAVEKARISLQEDVESVIGLATALEVKGDLLRQIGYLEDSRLTYLESLELLNGRAECTEQLAGLSASVGVLYDTVENDEEAIRFYERAIELYERLDPPALLKIADICNNLGFIYRSLGDFNSSEKLFLRGLEICHKELGDDDEKTATICNNIGALYLKSGFDGQALEMHTMALEHRLKIHGRNHPDTAQSHANLALSMAQTGDVAGSRKHFEDAISIYERHIQDESHEYAAVVENYIEVLKSVGEEKDASLLLKKASKKLKKVANH